MHPESKVSVRGQVEDERDSTEATTIERVVTCLWRFMLGNSP